MKLSQALRIEKTKSQVISFVGAGGKTTALFLLAHELSPCLVTITAQMGIWQVREADRHFVWIKGKPLPDFEAVLGSGVTLVTGEQSEQKYRGLDEDQSKKLRQLAAYHDLSLLIEADGSRQKPLKAPAEHEPAIPDFADTVVVLAGLSALGNPQNEEFIHRSEIFGKLSSSIENVPINAEAVSNILLHPQGGLKNIPANARKVIILNQADTPQLQASAASICPKLLNQYDAAIVASLNQNHIYAVYEPIAGIILAAGGSQRMGKPKQLLNFHGKSFIRNITETALNSGLFPIKIITGAEHERISRELRGLQVEILFNENWGEGQSASIRKGVEALKHTRCGGAVFLLADQPQVNPAIIRALVAKHAQSLPEILAPMVEGRRANPVLFDRVTFENLLALSGDVGGRGIFHQHHLEYLEWLDSSLLIDVDTHEDYTRLTQE